MTQFEPCWRRIRRAEAHRQASVRIWNRIVAQKKPYGSILKVYVDGTGDITLVPRYRPQLTDKSSLELGEMFYQLRAALDSCIYEAAILETGKTPPPDENKLEFPIIPPGKRKADFEDKAFMLGPLSEKRRAIIESIQPYNTPELPPHLLVFNFNRALEILNNWARIDRHRRLHVVGAWFSDTNIATIRCPPGVTVEELKVIAAGFLEYENVIATFRLKGYSYGMKVDANTQVTIDVALNEPPPPCADSDTLENRLGTMLMAVANVVRSIENTF